MPRPSAGIADPTHERHEECREWMPENFDPKIVDVIALADNVEALAKRWSRKPAKPAKAR
jgi:hypothetical protein